MLQLEEDRVKEKPKTILTCSNNKKIYIIDMEKQEINKTVLIG